MQTIIMAIAVITKDNQVLLRKTDPDRNPYTEPWALFGGKLVGSDSIEDEMNKEFEARWNMTVRIKEKLWWDSDIKKDHDGETKRFIYLDVLCEVNPSSSPTPTNTNEVLEWVDNDVISSYELNPPSRTLLMKLGYIP